MIKIVTKIIIKEKITEQIFDWLINLDHERYRRWHPAHKSFKYLRRTENGIGSIVYFDEIFDGIRINHEWEVLKIKRDESILMKARTFYPLYLRSSLKKIGKNTEVNHEVLIGFSFSLARVFDWLVKKFIFTERKMKAVERHAIEEFKNLENLL